MKPGFSLNEQKVAVNHNLEITFTPDENTLSYKYRIINEKIASDYIEIDVPLAATITLDKEGRNEIEVIVSLANGTSKKYESGAYYIDKKSPEIILKQSEITLKAGEKFNALDNVLVTDNFSDDLSSKVKTNLASLNLNEAGKYTLTYEVSDEAGNIASKTVNILVTKENSSVLYLQVLLVVLAIILSILICYYHRSYKRLKRLSRYSVETINKSYLSFIGRLLSIYRRLLDKLGRILKKSEVLKKYSLRYEKYLALDLKVHKESIDFISSKFVSALAFLIIAIFGKAINYNAMQLYEIVIPLFLGFFIPDILLYVHYRIYISSIENDFLQAIIIMNNAFKSGRSITQAIDLVASELKGPIALEFKKMSLEISFGLSVEVVFKRFAERINLEEANYLTASLGILSKTGGNIIKVFSSIEESLFNRKRLNLELTSLTGSSRIIVYVLFLVPLIFAAFISVINPTYFLPLFQTKIGLIILFVIIITYIIYIFFVKKIMKVRM